MSTLTVIEHAERPTPGSLDPLAMALWPSLFSLEITYEGAYTYEGGEYVPEDDQRPDPRSIQAVGKKAMWAALREVIALDEHDIRENISHYGGADESEKGFSQFHGDHPHAGVWQC